VDHASRRERLAGRLEDLGVDAFLVTRLPNVRYLAGFTGSNGQLLVTTDGGMFLTDGRYEEQTAREAPGLQTKIYSGEFAGPFAEACVELGARSVAFEAAGLTFRSYEDLAGTPVKLVPTRDEVERLRWIKDPEEIELLRAAQALTDDGFDFITKKLVEGVTEKEAAFELDTFLRRSGDGVAFDTIVAFGESAAEPHHSPTDRLLSYGEVVKMDFGALVGGYHADMTRTVAFGRASPPLEEVYEIVRRAQQAGVDAVAAGVTGAQADRAARDIVTEAGYGDQFKHSLGHGVGLEVHEGPSLRVTSADVLPEGTVVTVEPGIYLHGVGGVRIEDMVEVTSAGARVMPRTTKELVVL